jgi:hypothetical protein
LSELFRNRAGPLCHERERLVRIGLCEDWDISDDGLDDEERGGDDEDCGESGGEESVRLFDEELDEDMEVEEDCEGDKDDK